MSNQHPSQYACLREAHSRLLNLKKEVLAIEETIRTASIFPGGSNESVTLDNTAVWFRNRSYGSLDAFKYVARALVQGGAIQVAELV